MTASGGDKASSPHFFFVQSCPAGGASLPAFFCRRRRPTTGRDGPCSVCGRPGAPRPARCLGRKAPCGRGRPRGGGPPAPGGGGLGQLRYAAGRVQAGPVLARPGRPRPIAAARPCPAPARGPSPPLVLAGGWRRGPRPVVGLRPVSLLAACVRGAAAPPPGRSAVGRWPGRWLWPPWRGVGGLACVRAPPASYPTSPGGAPPAARRRGGGGPLSGARPWFSLGWSRPPLGGPKAPRPRTLPNARARRHDAARATGVWCLAACGRRWNGAPLRAAARRPPHEGGWGLDSAACGRRGTSTGRKGRWHL